jgi:hypothetical protein
VLYVEEPSLTVPGAEAGRLDDAPPRLGSDATRAAGWAKFQSTACREGAFIRLCP